LNQLSELFPNILQAVRILHDGGLVAFPTETVYGLGADARNPEAIKGIFAAKGRPSDHPLIVHLADAGHMNEWAQDIPEAAWKLAEAFWPGPLTLILPRHCTVPDSVTGGLDTVALRVPEHPIALVLLSAFGSGIAAPSANRYGHVSPTSAEDVKEELGEKVDLVLDGGRCVIGIESTIVDLSTEVPRVLRPGKITETMIYSVLNSSKTSLLEAPPHHPGDKPSHYAPNARLILASQENVRQHIEESLKSGQRVGLMASQLPAEVSEHINWIRLSESIEDQAYELYHSLRHADHLGLQILIVMMPSDIGIGHALRDRLRRAAGLGNTDQWR